MSFYNSEKILFVVNKIDLPQKFFAPDNLQLIKISAKKNFGLDDLRKNIKKIVFGKNIFDKSNEIFVCNVRHKTALKNSYDSLMRALKTISNDLPIDLTVIDLRDAYDFLGEIIGQSVSDKITDEIFSKFCVGK